MADRASTPPSRAQGGRESRDDARREGEAEHRAEVDPGRGYPASIVLDEPGMLHHGRHDTSTGTYAYAIPARSRWWTSTVRPSTALGRSRPSTCGRCCVASSARTSRSGPTRRGQSRERRSGRHQRAPPPEGLHDLPSRPVAFATSHEAPPPAAPGQVTGRALRARRTPTSPSNRPAPSRSTLAACIGPSTSRSALRRLSSRSAPRRLRGLRE